MKQNLKRMAAAAISAMMLTACGGDRNGLNGAGLPGTVPGYDPTNSNTYTPLPNTHGYDPAEAAAPTYTVMSNTFLRVDPEVGVFIKRLDGRLEAKRQGDPIIFDDVRSFVTYVYRAELDIDQDNISKLHNKFTFNFQDSPIRNVQIQFTPGAVKMSGEMKQVLWVPFSMEGTISPTPDGKIQLVPNSIKVSGISVKSMMDMIGLTTSKLLTVPAERGVQFQGNNIILDCSKLFPPPTMYGKVVGTQILQGKLHITFDNGQRLVPRTPPDVNAQNYLHVYGGRVLIMNELHRGAELQMVDQNPANPFDFYLAGYLSHLKAGYVKVVNDPGTLIALMPDFTQLGSTQIWDGYPGGKPQLRASSAAPTSGSQAASTAYASQGFMPYSDFYAQVTGSQRH